MHRSAPLGMHVTTPAGRRPAIRRNVIASLLCLATLGLGCSKEAGTQGRPGESPKPGNETAERKPAPPALVEVTQPRRGPIRDTITVNSDVQAERTVKLTSQVSGTVREVFHREGDVVQAGEVLIELDDRDLRLSAAREEIAHSEAGQRAAAAALDHREAVEGEQLQKLAVERAEREFARFERMLGAEGRKAFSEEEYETKKFALDEARIAHEKAKLVRERIEVQKELARLAAESARVAWDRALLDLERSTFRAPIEGVVAMLALKPGELVQVGSSIATLVNSERLYAEVRIPQRRIRALSVGQRVELTSEAHAEIRFTGAVQVIHPTVDPKEGTIKVRIGIDDPQRQLRPGLYVTATIVTETVEHALLVPKRARLFDGDDSIIFVVRENRAVRIPIRPGLSTVDELQVLEAYEGALLDGDHLVIRGQNGLKNGAEVLIDKHGVGLPADTESAPAPSAKG